MKKLRAALSAIDFSAVAASIVDVLALTIVGVGLWWISPAVSLVVVGSLLLGIRLTGRILGVTRTGAKND